MITFGAKVLIIAGFYTGCLGYVQSHDPSSDTYKVQAKCIPSGEVTALNVIIDVTKKEMRVIK